jgi:hypothetical protein
MQFSAIESKSEFSIQSMIWVPPPPNLQVSVARQYTVKKVAVFLSPAGMSLTKLFLAGNILIIPGQREFGYG